MINNTSQMNTITDSDGFFEIDVALGDEIIFSSVQYRIRSVIITDEILKKNRLVVSVNENINELFVNNCMLFLMKEDITPLWEDSKNKQGGCFSYKINNKITYNTWKKTSFLLVGCLLTNSISHYNDINGITISPKKSFCIIKIWFCNCNNQNPSIIKEESGLSSKGCLFKKHIS